MAPQRAVEALGEALALHEAPGSLFRHSAPGAEVS